MKLGIIVAATLALFLSSCATGIVPITPNNLKQNQIVLVGKITFNPKIVVNDVKDNDGNFPLDPTEDKLKLTSNTVQYFLVTNQAVFAQQNLSENPLMSEYTIDPTSSSVTNKATQDKVFIAAGLKTDTLYLNGFYSYYYNSSAAIFPYPCTIKVPEGARAIYIGTIAFERDKFYKVTSVSRKDEYDEALKEFQKTFPGWELVRADVTVAK